MNRKVATVLGALIVVGAGVGLYVANSGDDSEDTEATSAPVASTAPAQSPAAVSQAEVEIKFTSSGFTPSKVTAKPGQTIRITNDGGGGLDFSSDPHPTHTNLSALNLGSIANGQSKTVTLSKTGSFGFHNHLNPSEKGTIVVQ